MARATSGRGEDEPLPQTKGAQTGFGLKSGLNMADTGSVVHQVKGQIRLGRQRVSGNYGRNNMVSANGSRKR